jgi:arylsulfatase
MATCLDVAHATYPAEFKGERITPPEGASLRPAFLSKPIDRRRPLVWEHEGNRALRSGKWKIVSRENRPWELYDIEADRPESHDLASKHPRRVADMARQWEEWAARAHVLPLGAWRGK